MRNRHVSDSIHLGDKGRQRFETLSPTGLISRPSRLSCISQSSLTCSECNNIEQYQLTTRPAMNLRAHFSGLVNVQVIRAAWRVSESRSTMSSNLRNSLRTNLDKTLQTKKKIPYYPITTSLTASASNKWNEIITPH